MYVFEELSGVITEVSKKKVRAVILPERELNVEVMGIMPMKLRKFFVVLQDAKKEVQGLDVQLAIEISKLRKKKKLTKKALEELNYKNYTSHSAYRDTERLFWSAIRREFPETFGMKQIFIQKDWEIAVCKPCISVKSPFFEPCCPQGETLRVVINHVVFEE